MTKKYSQDQCLERFIEEMKRFYKALEEIDLDTPYSTNPPNWWLELEGLRNITKEKIKKLNFPAS